jgi:hypothetical protein
MITFLFFSIILFRETEMALNKKLSLSGGSWWLVLTLVWVLGAARAGADTSYSIQGVKLVASNGLPADLMKSLRPEGTRLIADSSGVETAVCEIFWARALAGKSGTSSPKQIFYGNLRPGALMGMVHFLVIQDYVRDFRSQTIRPGYYTMRYAVVQGGIAENEPRDAVVLLPVAQDRVVERAMPVAELTRRSQMALHTRGPAVISLVEVDTDLKDFPGVATDDEGTCTLQVKVRVRSGNTGGTREMPLAIVLVTSIPENSGS